jgi:putative spermidine/putrescine transport system substrate-binding protein
VEDVLRSTLWEPFAQHTGCRIEPAHAGFAAATPSPGAAGPVLGAPTADLTLADPITALRAKRRNELASLPPDVVPTVAIGQLVTGFAAPAFAYALVNTRHRDAFPEGGAPGSWDAWWDTAAFPGGRSIGRNPIGTLEIALLADGVPPARLYPLDVPRALASLQRIVDAVDDRWWSRGIEPVGWLGSGRAELATAWHHRVVAGQRDGLAVDLAWSAALLVVDQWLVPANAREPEIAGDLIRFALTPERQAALARETRLGPVVPEALRLIEPWLLPTIPTAPPQRDQLVALDPSWWTDAEDATRAEFDRWFEGAAGRPREG